MSSEPIAIVHNEEASRFEANIEGQLALVEYRREEQRIAYTHTEVPEELEGQGIGSQLARHVLDYAREEKLRVLPLCPFIAAYIRRHPEFQSLVSS
jgi:uncharacterized protein